MDKFLTSFALVTLFCLLVAGCKKENTSITDSGNDQNNYEQEEKDTSAFVVAITSLDSGDAFVKTNELTFAMECFDKSGNRLIVDSIEWNSDIDGIFGQWKNPDGSEWVAGMTRTLSVGEHKITAIAYRFGTIGYKKISITVLDSFRVKSSFENRHWTVYPIPTEYVYTMESDLLGNILVGTLGSGVLVHENDKWISYTTTNSSLLSDEIQCIAVDHENNIYIGHWEIGGINKFDGVSWSTINFPDTSRYSRDDVHSITFDKDNELWFGVHTGQIFSYDGDWHKITPGYPYYFEHPGKIMFDSKGNLWGNSEHNYSFKYDGINWQLFNTIPMSYEMTIDKNDNVWFGTWSKGLYSFNGTEFINYSADDPIPPNNKAAGWAGNKIYNAVLPTNEITALTVDKNDSLWVGTTAGLVYYDGVNWTLFNKDNSDLPDNFITCLAVDNQNNVWIGTRHKVVVYKR